MNTHSEDQKARDDIEKYGCHILHVLEDESGPCFTYSIGIEKNSEQPELIVTGLNGEVSQWMINQYKNRILDGEVFAAGKMYSDFLEGFDIQFRPMSKRHYKKYLGRGLWLYEGDDFQVNQLIWPSTEGVWPWEKTAPADYTYFHPLLFEMDRLDEN